MQPEIHIQIDKALVDLRKDNILIIGSGFSFHNIKEFFAPSAKETQAMNESFGQWLINWASAPAARYCHPREEHLLPLHVCYGVASAVAKRVFEMEIMGKMASAYIWQDELIHNGLQRLVLGRNQ